MRKRVPVELAKRLRAEGMDWRDVAQEINRATGNHFAPGVIALAINRHLQLGRHLLTKPRRIKFRHPLEPMAQDDALDCLASKLVQVIPASSEPKEAKPHLPRGRKVGQLQNARDARGWMVPREGTVRRAVYDAMVAGQSRAAIRIQLALTDRAYYQHRACIMRAEKVNAWRRVAA